MATIPQVLARAIEHHRAGRLQAAEQIYRQILAVAPDQPDALHLLGVIASQAGKPEVAVQYIERAIRLRGNAADFHNNLGEAYRALGKIPEAEACYRRALELKPDFTEAHYNLGNTLAEQGKPNEAVACYHRAVELKPDFAEAHNNLGNVLKDQGKLAEAEACYRRALELKPDVAEVHNNLGAALSEMGRPDEAAACHRRALELKPDFAEANGNLGNALRDQGKLDQAIACYRRALELKPGFARAYGNLGNVLRDRGELEQAIGCYRRALELNPDYAMGHRNLGAALQEQGKLDEAAASYRRALELKADYAEAHSNLGDVLRKQGTLAEAIACYGRALSLKPDFAEAHGNLGCALVDLGDMQDAEDSFRAALRHDGRFAFAHYKLADLRDGKLPAEDLAAQRRLLQEADLTAVQRLLLYFSLARVLDAQGDYAEAAEHLARGNALQLSEWGKRGQQYDPQAHESFVARTIAVCTPDFFRRVSGFGLESELPVFVVGLPRSGTTLIEQVLASHGRVFGAGEIRLAHDSLTALGGEDADIIEGLGRLDRETARRLALRHLEKLRALDPAALRIVDKMPENYLALGLMATLFPRAKFIHCRRDLRDVAVSCWMTHFREIRWANDYQHIASRFRQYQRMMAHWRQALPAPLLEVDYEETVSDLENVARKLVAWCGLEWDPKCLQFHRARRPVSTASAVQVRRPLYATSVGRWRHYEQPLEPLFAAISHATSSPSK
jgi:tetratricopeptide (TPR) repeat protein